MNLYLELEKDYIYLDTLKYCFGCNRTKMSPLGGGPDLGSRQCSIPRTKEFNY